MRQPVKKEASPVVEPLESGLRPVKPPQPSPASVLPRLQSSPDLEGSATTLMSAAIADLARLFDQTKAPKLLHPIGRDLDLTPHETHIASLLGTGVDVKTIIGMSPLSDDETLHFLARLVMLGVLTIPSNHDG